MGTLISTSFFLLSPSVKNNKVHKDVQAMMALLRGKGYKPGGVCSAAQKRRAELIQWGCFKDNAKKPCLDFMLGECTFKDCKYPHLKDTELDNGFVKYVVDELKEGVAKINLMGGAALQRRKGP